MIGTSFYAHLDFEVAKDMPKINVKELTVLLYHHIPGMSVPDAKDIGGDKVRSTGTDVVLLGDAEIFEVVGVMGLEEEKGCFLVKGVDKSWGIILVNFGVVIRIDKLDETKFIACW